jgi:hypothetical protein
MKPNQYLSIAVRLFSIILFIEGLRQLVPLLELTISGTVNGMMVSYFFAFLMAILPILFSVVLWFFPVSVSALILRPEIDQDVVPLSQGSWLVVILIGLGLYTLYYAVSDSMSWIYVWHMSTQGFNDGVDFSLRGEDKANMFITFLEVLASLSLVLKAKTISRYLLKIAS